MLPNPHAGWVRYVHLLPQLRKILVAFLLKAANNATAIPI
jgi:hypothetical protein